MDAAGDAVTRRHRAMREIIRPYIRRTPIEIDGSEFGLATTLSLKLELLQHSGSFRRVARLQIC